MEAGSIPEPKVSNRENCILMIQIFLNILGNLQMEYERLQITKHDY